MSLVIPKSWPLSVARTTGTENIALLHTLLAVSSFDEISNADDFAAVESYIKSQGKVDDSGKTTVGVVFWVYPTGLHGPFHETGEGDIRHHGVLLTIEPGVSVVDAVQKARDGLVDDSIRHEHVGA